MRRGEIYYAAVPFLPEAPLSFFIRDVDKEGRELPSGKIKKQLDTDNLRGKPKNPMYLSSEKFPIF